MVAVAGASIGVAAVEEGAEASVTVGDAGDSATVAGSEADGVVGSVGEAVGIVGASEAEAASAGAGAGIAGADEAAVDSEIAAEDSVAAVAVETVELRRTSDSASTEILPFPSTCNYSRFWCLPFFRSAGSAANFVGFGCQVVDFSLVESSDFLQSKCSQNGVPSSTFLAHNRSHASFEFLSQFVDL